MPTFKLKWINTHTDTYTYTHPKSHLKILAHRSIECSILHGKQDVCKTHIWFTKPTSKYWIIQKNEKCLPYQIITEFKDLRSG